MRTKANYRTQSALKEAIQVARGLKPAELVFKGIHYLDVFSGGFQLGDVAVANGHVVGIGESYAGKQEIDGTGFYLVPGFIDSHVHIESSLMTPVRFQEAVLPFGTTAVVWDPHEIANVKGVPGIEWALSASEGLMLDVFVMVPSCVPSTSPQLKLETSGAELTAKDLVRFKSHPRVLGLAEMMNFPGLLGGDSDVIQKLFSYSGLARDGHCPGLAGRDLNAYAAAGIHSCHESTRLDEAQEKLSKGIHVLIREGSCAKDANTLLPLINAYSSAVLGLASDDRNPLDIAAEGHISAIIAKALQRGIAPQEIFRAAAFAPARMYGLGDRGAVAPGFIADLVMVQPADGKEWRSGLAIDRVFKNGRAVVSADLSLAADKRTSGTQGANFKLKPVTADDFRLKARGTKPQKMRVIGVIPRQILTRNVTSELSPQGGFIKPDLTKDILPIAVLERHHGTGQRTVALVTGFQLKRGAIATSINHDSHNVITVGASPEAMASAVNELMRINGGIVVTDGAGTFHTLPLTIGGLMTDSAPHVVAQALTQMKSLTQALGCTLSEPSLQLSFLALPVIPSLKITDRGLVDVDQFAIVSLEVP